MSDNMRLPGPRSKITTVATKRFDRVTINRIDGSAFPTMRLDVSVTDRAGNPVPGLTDADFEVYEDGTPVTAIHVTLKRGTAAVADVVFVFDTTGSMSEEIEGLKQTCLSFADALAAGAVDVRLALVAFGEKVREVYEPTGDPHTFKQWVATLSDHGGGAEDPYGALRRALALSFRPGAQRIVVLVTDEPPGGDEEGATSLHTSDAVGDVLAHNVGLFIVAEREPYEELAQGTAGMIIPIGSGHADFSAIVQRVGAILSNQYEIAYRSSKATRPGASMSVHVVGHSTSGKIEATRTFVPSGAGMKETFPPHVSGKLAGQPHAVIERLGRDLLARFLTPEREARSHMTGVLDPLGFSAWTPFRMDRGERFITVITWPGSVLEVRIADPTGRVVARRSGDSPPLVVEFTATRSGMWSYLVRAVDVPHRDYPYAALVVAPKASIRGGTVWWALIVITVVAAGTVVALRLRPAVRTSPGMLVEVSGPGKISLRRGITRIGRGPDNEMVLDDPSVSRHHARIVVDRTGIRIEDLGSTNGTQVNGKPVRSAPLQPGDVLIIGGRALRVEDSSEA